MASLDNTSYKQEEEIARGRFGVVYKGRVVSSNEPCAIKVLSKRSNKKADVSKEVTLMKAIKHPSVIAFIDFYESKDQYVLVTELLSGGELFDYVVQKEFLPELEAKHYLKQILSGLQHMHSKGIVHLDLKPENIVLKDPSAQRLTIIDLGMAQDLSTNRNVKVMAGTPEFVAPEVINYDPLSCAADMWSLGVVTYVLLTGMSPFLGDNDMETISNVTSGEFEWPEPDPDESIEVLSAPARDFIEKLLAKRPKERLTAQDALTHMWFEREEGVKIKTTRLKAFRARRKFCATIHAVRAISRISSISSKTCRSMGIGSLSSNGSTSSSETDKSLSLPRSLESGRKLCTSMGDDDAFHMH
ncbi:hypothetical protein EMCRGX_G022491 [Ephydatia muelleri]|eukprot:Em0009g1238a